MQEKPDRNGPSRRAGSPPVRVVSSRELFDGGQRVDIQHEGQTYRLQITRQGKLILTK